MIQRIIKEAGQSTMFSRFLPLGFWWRGMADTASLHRVPLCTCVCISRHFDIRGIQMSCLDKFTNELIRFHVDYEELLQMEYLTPFPPSLSLARCLLVTPWRPQSPYEGQEKQQKYGFLHMHVLFSYKTRVICFLIIKPSTRCALNIKRILLYKPPKKK